MSYSYSRRYQLQAAAIHTLEKVNADKIDYDLIEELVEDAAAVIEESTNFKFIFSDEPEDAIKVLCDKYGAQYYY